MIGSVLPAPRRLDLIVLGCAVALAVLGVTFIASTAGGGHLKGLAARQAIWIAVGLGGLVAAVLFDYRTLLKVSFALYLASLVPLVYLLVFGQRIANVRSWIRFGGFQFQPAELAKITTAVLVAYLLENEDETRMRLSTFVKLGAIVGIPFLLVFVQPDLGLALTFLPLLIVGLFFGRLPLRGWIAIFIAVAVLAGAGWLFLKDYQKQRIETFLNPDRDVLKAGYQVRQSKIAVGSGGFSGKGIPRRHAEPAAVPARPAHRLHPGRDRRGVGVPRRDPRARPLRRDAPAMFDARAGRARPRRRVPDPGALRDDVLFGRGQRRP
jgi:rod shape determining protein RodA